MDTSYQVAFHLAKGFQRRRLKCEKLTDDRRHMPSDGKSSNCLWQGELKMKIYFIEELLNTISAKFCSKWKSSFRGIHFLHIGNQKPVFCSIKMKLKFLYSTWKVLYKIPHLVLWKRKQIWGQTERSVPASAMFFVRSK